MGGKPLGYNIKYIDPLPGNKLKRPMYEIKPGVWIHYEFVFKRF